MSDNLQRCNICNGRKSFISFGMMEKKCTECNGIGWVDLKKDEPLKQGYCTTLNDEIVPLDPEIIEKKKPGRPKKLEE